MTTATTGLSRLYRARAGVVDFVDVPELGYVVVDGYGAPGDGEFALAIQAIYGVSYAAHFLVKKREGEAPRVMPLEALWWVDDEGQQDIMAAVAAGTASPQDSDKRLWRWRALLMQPEPIGAADIEAAVDAARRKSPGAALDALRYLRWSEGLVAQVLHVGPYASEAPTIARLHDAIAAAGYRPRGHHHEIYLGDPRRSAPERLRTILRHPVEPA